jgi:peptidoglycan/LPS O-acetylase OafA/YrhL
VCYRRDVDGLRAVAVGTVVLFYAGVTPFTSVDVFS